MAFDVQGALKAGYTQDEINQYLAQQKTATQPKPVTKPPVAPTSQPVPQKQGGLVNMAIDNLPTIGSLVGGVAGTPLGPVGSVGLSGVGSAAGEALRQKIRGEKMNVGKIGTEGGIGLAGGVGGELVSGVSRIAGRALFDALPERILGTVFKEGMKDTKAGIKAGTSLAKEALDRGEMGTTKQILDRATGKIGELEDTLQGLLKGSSATVPLNDVQKTVDPLIQKYKQAGLINDANGIQTAIDNIRAANGDHIPVAEANNIKRTLYDAVNNNYGQRSASESIEGVKQIARGLKESIAKVPGVPEINKDLSYYGRIKDSMVDKMARGGRNNVVSLTDAILASPSVAVGPAGLIPVAAKKAAESTIGKTVTAQGLKTAGKIAGMMPNMGPAIGQLGARSAASFIQKSQQQPDNGQEQQGPVTDVPHTDSIPPQQELPPVDQLVTIRNPQTGEVKQVKQSELAQYTGQQSQAIPTRQQIAQAMMKDLAETGGKHINELKTLMDATSQNPGKMTVAGQQQQNLAKSGMRGLAEAESLLQKDPNLLTKQLIPGQVASRQFDSALFRTVEALLRSRSGAAVPESEVRRYMSKFAPTFGDDPQTVKFKMAQLKQDFADVLSGSSNVQDTLPPVDQLVQP